MRPRWSDVTSVVEGPQGFYDEKNKNENKWKIKEWKMKKNVL